MGEGVEGERGVHEERAVEIRVRECCFGKERRRGGSDLDTREKRRGRCTSLIFITIMTMI